MKDFKVAGFPLPLYVLILALTAACMFTGCVPKSLVPAFLVLMVFGEGLNAIGNNVPVVKTYLGGCLLYTSFSGKRHYEGIRGLAA